MKSGIKDLRDEICYRLMVDDPRYIEIESKKRVLIGQIKELKKYLKKSKKTTHTKSTFFFDQFLDTPKMDLFRLGASLRLRYKKNGTEVYLQYKGPGYIENGLLYRSEFSTGKLKDIIKEESGHDTVHFSKTTFKGIMQKYVHREMAKAMRRQLGSSVVENISNAPFICMYQKDKYLVDLGSAFLEPSVDKMYAFHISRSGPHPLSTFCEFENEIKAPNHSFGAKVEHIPDLLEFNLKLLRKFNLKEERLDKYHRCASLFLPREKVPIVNF